MAAMNVVPTLLLVAGILSPGISAQALFPGHWSPLFANVAGADQSVLGEGIMDGLSPSMAGCAATCEILSAARADRLHIHGSAAYEKAKSTFWSMAQRELYPSCIYQPTSPSEVSLGLTVARLSRCPFAIKSGGHGKFSGESNVDGGLTIDLVGINHVVVADDKQSVHIGPGNRWVDVYTALEPLGIVVAGGRDAGVGVGGFLMGGGISFHSSEYGWGADTIISYEVVLANGTVTKASPTSNTDLYKALRGGGANFGVVTSFEMLAIPYTGIWGGMITHAFSETRTLFKAFLDYGLNSLKYPKASAILNFGPDFQDGKTWIWYNDIQYTEPEPKPEGLQALVSVPNIGDETAVSNLSTQSLGLSRFTVPGRRYAYWVMSTKLDERILNYFLDTWVTEFGRIQPQFEDFFRPTFNVQVITAGMRRNMARNGGSVLGLAGSEEPLLLYNPTPKWVDPAKDILIAETVHKVLEIVKAEARRLHLDDDFLYMNYASEWQEPLASYGLEMGEFMHNVAEKYDPQGVFQYLQPGSFKLKGLPGYREALEVDLSV